MATGDARCRWTTDERFELEGRRVRGAAHEFALACLHEALERDRAGLVQETTSEYAFAHGSPTGGGKCGKGSKKFFSVSCLTAPH
jgi:hypothetical protein